jgi:glycosyltransferase involved in cell wall biosynthesis
LKVVLLSEVFAKNMGYLENFLPKYLSRLGVDVHVVTLGLPPYYHAKESRVTYRGFADGRDLSPGDIETFDGFTVHVLPHKRVLGYMRMGGFTKKLRSIRPDIVQTTASIGWIPLQAAMAKPFLGYQLFTGNHFHASVFPIANRKVSFWSKELLRCKATRTLPGWLVSLATEKCYAISSDCAEIAVKFFGVPKNKVDVCTLGVDTGLFYPVSTEADRKKRLTLRQRLGFLDSEIVCIYTGRFAEDKNALLLAQAVAQLAGKGEPYRGLFLGNGPQGEAIEGCAGCQTRPFVPVGELGDFYRASDIGVWPTQESTSMLDGAACGLPIVANHTMSAPERVNGNGATYQLNNLDDLVRVLLELRDPQTRHALGSFGARKMAQDFSWDAVARRRLRDYESALRFAKAPRARHVDPEEAAKHF